MAGQGEWKTLLKLLQASPEINLVKKSKFLKLRFL